MRSSKQRPVQLKTLLQVEIITRWYEFLFILQAILQDLFPGVSIPEHDYGRLQEEIESVATDMKLQVVPSQIKKVIQLYETMLVRHGVMLVGPTGGGKTCIYRVREKNRLTDFI